MELVGEYVVPYLRGIETDILELLTSRNPVVPYL